MRILIIRLSALGDVLLATPVARELKRLHPDATIDWLVEAPYLPLLAANPHARPIPYEKRGRHGGLRGLLALRGELKRNRYDLVVDLQAKPKTALLRVAPRSLVLRKRTFGEALLSLLGRNPPTIQRHAVNLFLDLLGPSGEAPEPLTLHIPEEGRREFATFPPSERPRVGLALSARWGTKCWPAERYGALALALEERGYRPLLLVGPGEEEVLRQVRVRTPEALDTASLSVGGLAAAIDDCRLVIGGDSGPLHIAAALGKPVVALFGPTSPARWHPVASRLEVVRLPLSCSPCSNHGTATCPLGHHDCMTKLEVAPVLEAVDRLLP